jgi:hypothetical protein
MRVPHSARRPLAALVLALVALTAGCGGGDSNAPDAPFDPEGTSSDIGAMEASFETPAMAGYASAAAAISAVLGESPAAAAVRVVPTKALITGGKPAAAHYSTTIARAYVKPAGGIRPSFSTAAILDEHLGVTFTYDPETDQYGPSDLTGAPENGVRFVVYAVNGVTGMPVEPLIEVGYADIVATETASSATVRVELVSAGVTYLDYAVGVTGTASAVSVTISGFVTNGDDRVDFDLDNHIDITNESITLDYNLTVPTRGGFRIDFEGEMSGSTVTTSLEARGPHGTVTISGTQTTSSGSFEVEVNGELFATVTTSETGPTVIAGAEGQPLTQAELQALEELLTIFIEGFEFIGDLFAPIGQ